MPHSSEGRRSNLDTPRSPVSSSIDSSRRGSLKPHHPEKDSVPPTPPSPPVRLTGKRAASLELDSANQRIGDLALNSASTGPPSLSSTREQVCLCQPDPKIPRPRNAFILFRQHYQQSVVQQHPGLSNPEISKIIGEQWRDQAPEVKAEWKRLAEEEKQRHQRQYPGYRYQPRRADKPNSTRPVSSSSSDDPVRCPKCGGRYISTPSTPFTPFPPSAAGPGPRSERLLPPFTPSRLSEVERAGHQPHMQNPRMERMERMDSPRMALPYQQVHRRPQYPPPQPLHTHHERDEDMGLLSPTPEQKRRRFNEGPRGYSGASPTSYSAPQGFARTGAPPMSAGGYRQQQLPGPGAIMRPGPMGPPPQRSPMNPPPRHQYPARSNTFDESLRLPPLQTQIASSAASSSQRGDQRRDSREIQAKSVEAMVMTIPYANKIKVLAKIALPLAPPGPSSPAHDIRGAIIAVEGHHKSLLNEIGTFITEHLSQDPSCSVKTWSVSPSKERAVEPPSADDTEMTDAALMPTPTQSKGQDPFVEYLTTISSWHKNSLEMIKYITNTRPESSSSSYTDASASKSKILPIVLIPQGYSLSTSNAYALLIPINDSYAPVDHWQWMATLWRGIVGPDLTIYATRAGREEMEKFGGVEIRGDCSTIVVRVPEDGDREYGGEDNGKRKGRDGDSKGENGREMDEKTARRLGFEVLEFVRNLDQEKGFRSG